MCSSMVQIDDPSIRRARRQGPLALGQRAMMLGASLCRRHGAARRVRRLARAVDFDRRDGNERRRLQHTFSLAAWH
jgi:hypothetical protein